MSKYERKSKPIRELVNQPDVQAASNVLKRNTEGLHHTAPNISQSLQTKGAQALQYLNAKLPKPMSEMIGDEEFEPSEIAKHDWLDLHSIVHDPISVLDHVRHGTLLQKHVDALNEVHPELLQEMREKVMGEMEPSRVKSLPNSTKMALGTFLGAPITASGNPQAILSNQNALQSAPSLSNIAKGSKSTLGGLKQLNLANRSTTETEDLEKPE